MMQPIGSIEIGMDDDKYQLVIPEDCTGYEAACLAHMLAFATVSNTALDFKTYIQEQRIERLWERVEKQPTSV
ncbi:MAG: hypothetical protein EB117_17725 [Betaproteobacteria bacterium]|nr:hypothetical protein [Betaproteobacteria bacterium]